MEPNNNYINRVFSFLYAPKSGTPEKLTLFTKFKYLNFSFLLIFVGAFLSIILTQILETSGIMPKFNNLAITSISKHYSALYIYIIVVLIAPIIEELAFRTLLVFSKINLVVSSGFLFYLYASFYVGGGYLLNIATLYKISGSVITAFLVSRALNKNNVYINIKSWWEDYYSIIFYVSAIAFAYLHLSNYGNIGLMQVLFSPIIVLPFFIYAIVLGFVRVKLGLHWAIMLHIMLNGFVRLIKLV